jgi:hypothetical protein
VGHVEGALPALGERRAGGGNDDGVAHVISPDSIAAISR